MVTHPGGPEDIDACQAWLATLLQQETRILIPEIADYELRRELLRAKKIESLARLDALKQALEFLPLTTETMLVAAECWAQARQAGKPTADPKSLDGDVILAAQALTLKSSVPPLVVTTNTGHLSRFVDAAHWRDFS